MDGAWDHLVQTFTTEHPVFATAAAMQRIDRLHSAQNEEAVASLTDWIQQHGDAAVVIEHVFYLE